jgi:hypothetical protein
MASEDAVRYRWLVVLFAAMSVSADAQWLNFVPPGTPKTADGKPDLRAHTPRTADGKPDLSGTWMHELTSAAEMKRLFGAIIDEAIKVDVPGMEIGTQHKYAMNILLDSKPGEVSMTPEGAAVMKQRMAAADPSDVCRAVPGFPLAGLLSEPIKIVQAPKTTIVLYEAGSLHRQIFSDGRTFPQEFELPAFLGYSVGRWEGDVFVVETRGFNDKTPLDAIGHPHSESLRVTERFRRIDFGHLDVEMTFDDPRMYTKPFTVKIPHTLIADQDIFEMFCENERDSAHIKNAKQPR